MSETSAKARKNTAVDPSILSNNLAPVATTSTVATAAVAPPAEARLPSEKTLAHAVKLCIENDMPLMMDYWRNSLDNTAFIGVYANNPGSKLLVKSDDEYTSTIQKMMRSSSTNGAEYIIMTENSIYIVASTIKQKRIS